MGSLLGTIAVGVLICVLFWLDRDDTPVSTAVWIPYAWLLIGCSRPITSWLGAPIAGDEYIDGSPIDRNVLTILILLGLVVLFKRGAQVRTFLRKNPLIILFFFYCLISLFWADYPYVVLKRWIRSVGDIVMILIMITEQHPLSAIKLVLKRLGILLIPLSILLIRLYPSMGRAYSREGGIEWTGVGTDKNALGMICMIFGVSLLWRWLSTYKDRRLKYRKQNLIAVGIVLAMILYLLLIVNSQTALSCFVMAGFVIVITASRPAFRKPVFMSVLVGAIVTASCCVLFLGLGTGALELLGRNPTLTGRTAVWQTLLPYAKNAWVGAGYENFWIGERMQLFTRLLGGLNQAHNGYIEIYLNLGWVGLLLLGAIIVTGYRNIMKEFRRDQETARLKLAFFVMCLVYNFTEATFKMQAPVWIFFLWSVMAVPKPRVRSRPQSSLVQASYLGNSVNANVPTSTTGWARA